MQVFRWTLYSLSIHLLLLAAAQFLYRPAPAPTQVVEIDYRPLKKNSNDKTIVRQLPSPTSPNQPWNDDPVHYLSEKTQRVKEQLRALKIGLTKNRGGKIEKTAKAEPDKKLGLKDLSPHSVWVPNINQSAAEEPGVSSMGNEVDEKIKIGSITALNTDRYIYYTYYARAEEQIRYYWETMMQAIESHPPPQMDASIHRKFTTELEVVYKKNGEFLAVHILKPSGVGELDQVAAESFRRVKMIPNPPKDKIDSDGLVKITYSLSVYYNPKVLVRQ